MGCWLCVAEQPLALSEVEPALRGECRLPDDSRLAREPLPNSVVRVRTAPLQFTEDVVPPPPGMDALNRAAWEARQEDMRRMLEGFRIFAIVM